MGIPTDSMSTNVPLPSERPIALPERYQIRRHIASGGMASVWCAEDRVLGRSVAVKVLAERFAHDHLAVLRFQREARAAARVSNHPHVVTVYDVGELEESAHASTDATSVAGRAFIVMEFLAGGTVADAIRHDALRRQEAMRWLREAASALDHAHARGIVHRDIKPANFLLDRGRVLHVADFGIARLMTEDTITSSDQLFGTAAYLSPEQALGREATGASDRYALAVAAFELLAGERPFSAPHFSAQARQHIEEPPPAASQLDRTLSPAVDEVLFAGLAKDPSARPASAGALVSALEDALRGRPPAGRPAGARRGRVRIPDPSVPTASTAAARRPEHPPASPPPADRAAQATGAHGRRRVVAVGALALAVIVTVGIAIAATRGSGQRGARLADRTTATTTHHRAHHARTAAQTHAKPKKKTHTTSTPTTTTVQSAANLETIGHEEMLADNYTAAIPTLKQAVATAPPDSVTYAYALYDLGRSEVLSGDPQAAIPVLRQRLQIPNQRGVVKVLLDEAIAQAGKGKSTSSGGAGATTGTSPTTATDTSTTTGSGGAGLRSGGPGATNPSAPTPAPGGQTTTPGAGHHRSFAIHLLTAAATD
jgi:hypothetical protein